MVTLMVGLGPCGRHVGLTGSSGGRLQWLGRKKAPTPSHLLLSSVSCTPTTAQNLSTTVFPEAAGDSNFPFSTLQEQASLDPLRDPHPRQTVPLLQRLEFQLIKPLL